MCLFYQNGFRPSEAIFAPCTTQEQGTGNDYIAVNTNGYVQCPSSKVGKLIFANFSYKVD